jgi:anion-transporting  ArsA/GET3 family ATPase
VPGSALFDRRLHVITGKGGVGRSTLAAALALLSARRGRRVLVCEVHAQERIAPLRGRAPSGAQTREVLPGLFTTNVTPRDAMREYGTLVLKFKAIYDAVFENRVARYFLRAIPSLSELVMLGKILHEVRLEERGRHRWDQVIVDAPATGHAVQLFRVPAALLDTVPPGPLRRDAQWMHGLLADPAVTAISLATLPEEMPVNEAIELDAAVRTTLRLPRGALFVNAMPTRRFTAGERSLLEELRGDPAPLGPAASAAYLAAVRSDEAEQQLARARAAIDLPAFVVPLVVREQWDRGAVEAVADALERTP